MRPLYIEAVGCCAPGLDGWAQAQSVLRGERPYVREELPAHPSQLLPANERRRAPLAVRLAFRVAEDALGGDDRSSARLASVFASSDGDTHISHRISLALAQPQRLVSPTDFHNSVHNAAAGYWSIATQAKLPSVSLSACHASFAAGLLEAGALAEVEDLDCLLVAFDVQPPLLLQPLWPITESTAFALILSPRRSARSLATLRVEPVPRVAETGLPDAGLEALRLSNAAARTLPLLALLARREPGTVLLDGAGEHSLRLDLEPL
ncbi:MAG: beta-ketoacyl synthase chain length factor [Immundisolibacter sp.]|uniref:beta-ketoacyl synthase chain length factor n=1 Tax=Immundisolibacter sp. TaxID=1934948 RepID=UPI003EDF710A